MNFNNDICLVVQGPTICEDVIDIKKNWNNIKIIFSTWDGSNHDCYSESDIILFNDIPDSRGVRNLNLQKVSSLNGFMHAKKLGFSRVIKWRQDMYPTNDLELLSLFKENHLNFYTFFKHRNGYVCDYFMEGNVDDMINLFTNIELNVPYPEYAITKSLFNSKLNDKVNFIQPYITENCNIYWKSKNFYLSDVSKSPKSCNIVSECVEYINGYF